MIESVCSTKGASSLWQNSRIILKLKDIFG